VRDNLHLSNDQRLAAAGVATAEATQAPRPPIRLGIIGTGLAARKLHWPALAKMPTQFDVVAFANRTRSTAEEFADFAGLPMDGYSADYRDLLDRKDVEAVLIGVPIPQILPIARDCLEAGKHVISEKPPGANEAEAHEYVQLTTRYPRLKVLMAEQVFYSDARRLARSLIDAGAIGQPRFLIDRVVKHEVPVPGRFSSTPWRHKPGYPGGSIIDGGVHNVAGIRVLCGDIVSLSARTEWLNSAIEAPSVLALNFGFASGGSGSLFYGSFNNPVVEETNDTRVYGTDGNLIVRWHGVRLIRSDGSTEEHVFQASNAFYNEFLNFYDAIVYDEPIVGTVAQSAKNMLILLRALDSADQGKTLDLSAEAWNLPADGVPLWRPRGATGLFDGLPVTVGVKAE
jgi:predicted dehydrogenase